jgi:NAD(P)H-dependent FMN reductase
MKYVIAGTNRPGSRTLKVANFIVKLYSEAGETVELIDLTQVGFEELPAAAAYGKTVPPKMKSVIEKINTADGVIVVCPEYNGSMPGALKYFIDHWTYPDTFEFRPFALVGLGFKWGGLRPVEHLQGVFGYRNGFIYPERVFITDIDKALDVQGNIVEPNVLNILKSQVAGFQKFTRALTDAGLDANSRLRAKKPAGQ